MLSKLINEYTTMTNYETIKKFISRLSVENRVVLIQYLSYCSIFYVDDMREKGSVPPNSMKPWNADIVTIICLFQEHESKIQKEPFSNEFFSYINSINHFLEGISFPKSWLDQLCEYGGHAVFSPLMLQQRRFQESIYSRLYRYNYVFNYNEKTNGFFKEQTGIADYKKLSFFALLSKTIKEAVGMLNDKNSFYRFLTIINAFLDNNEDIKQYLSISHSDFKSQTLDKCDINNIEELTYSYKVTSEKPIIMIDNQYYLLSMHSFDYACTDGLFINCTYQKEDMKNYIGKNVLEDYLYSITKEAGLYTLVPEDQKRNRFRYKKNYCDPADLIFKNESTVVMVESKECVHIRKGWINDKEAIENEYNKCVEGVKKFLNLYRRFKEGVYNPFNDSADKNKETFLVYLNLQFFPYNIKTVIERVTADAGERDYLSSRLFIMDYYTFELNLLYKNDIIPQLRKYSLLGKTGEYSNKGLTYDASNRLSSFKQFVDEITNMANDELDKIAFERFGIHLE